MVSLTRQAPTYWCCFLHRCILNAKLTLGWLKGIWASNFESTKKIFSWVKKVRELQPPACQSLYWQCLQHLHMITGMIDHEDYYWSDNIWGALPNSRQQRFQPPCVCLQTFFCVQWTIFFLKFYLNMAVQEDKHLSFCSPRTKDPEQIQI